MDRDNVISYIPYGKNTLSELGPVALSVRSETGLGTTEDMAASNRIHLAATEIFRRRGVPVAAGRDRFTPTLLFYLSSTRVGITPFFVYIFMASLMQPADLLREDSIIRAYAATWHSCCSGVVSDIRDSIDRLSTEVADSFADDYLSVNKGV